MEGWAASLSVCQEGALHHSSPQTTKKRYQIHSQILTRCLFGSNPPPLFFSFGAAHLYFTCTSLVLFIVITGFILVLFLREVETKQETKQTSFLDFYCNFYVLLVTREEENSTLCFCFLLILNQNVYLMIIYIITHSRLKCVTNQKNKQLTLKISSYSTSYLCLRKFFAKNIDFCPTKAPFNH